MKIFTCLINSTRDIIICINIFYYSNFNTRNGFHVKQFILNGNQKKKNSILCVYIIFWTLRYSFISLFFPAGKNPCVNFYHKGAFFIFFRSCSKRNGGLLRTSFSCCYWECYFSHRFCRRQFLAWYRRCHNNLWIFGRSVRTFFILFIPISKLEEPH